LAAKMPFLPMVGNAFLQFKADAIPFLKQILAFFPVVLKKIAQLLG
jgi:hypothetical protein